jgi:murein tripeptide amidase MpaA
MCNGLIKYLFSQSPEAEQLLEECVFYIVPIINPDGVIQGNFRCDSQGRNLNRFYDDPSPQEQP